MADSSGRVKWSPGLGGEKSGLCEHPANACLLPNHSAHNVSLTPVVFLPEQRQRIIGQVPGISVILGLRFPDNRFRGGPTTGKFISLTVLLFFRRTTKEDISQWLIPNQTRCMSSTPG